MAAGPLTPGGPTDLVTINPGSNTLDVLAGLGGGRFANPVAIQTQHPAQVVRMADFNHDGIPDLAVLDRQRREHLCWATARAASSRRSPTTPGPSPPA